MNNYTIISAKVQIGNLPDSLFGPKLANMEKKISPCLQADAVATQRPCSQYEKSTSAPFPDKANKVLAAGRQALEVKALGLARAGEVPGLGGQQKINYVAWESAGGQGDPRKRRALLTKKSKEQQEEEAEERRQSRYWLQEDLRKLLPTARCSFCQTSPIPVRKVDYAAGERPGVEIYFHPDSGSVSFAGLQVCSNVWACPLCSPKICFRRRRELEKAVNVWRGREVAGGLGESAEAIEYGIVVMLTFTVEHTCKKPLKTVLSALQGTYSAMKGTRSFTRLRQEQGLAHSVRALELTWGKGTGWHPHIHELLFVEGGVRGATRVERGRWVKRRVALLADLIWAQYEAAATRMGVTVSRKGFDVRYTEGDVGDYVAKFGRQPVNRNVWGASSELAKNHRKIGYKDEERAKKDRYTAWELLYRFADEGDAHAGEKFVEFYTAMHGKRQLVWSGGAKEFFLGSKEVQDEQIAQEVTEGSELIYILTTQEWDMVLRHNGRGELLNEAAKAKAEGVIQYLADLRRIEEVGLKAWLDEQQK